MFVSIFTSKCRLLFLTFAKYFILQNGFNSRKSSQNEIENKEVGELNDKCLAKFYVSVRKSDGSYYKKTSLLLTREPP